MIAGREAHLPWARFDPEGLQPAGGTLRSCWRRMRAINNLTGRGQTGAIEACDGTFARLEGCLLVLLKRN